MIVRLDRQATHAVNAMVEASGATPAQVVKAGLAALFPDRTLPPAPNPEMRADGALAPVHAWYVQFWAKPYAHRPGAPWALQTVRVNAASAKRAIRLARRGFRLMPGVKPGSPRFLAVHADGAIPATVET